MAIPASSPRSEFSAVQNEIGHERLVLTPRDRLAQHQGREVKGYEWHSAGLKRPLTSCGLAGVTITQSSLGTRRICNDISGDSGEFKPVQVPTAAPSRLS